MPTGRPDSGRPVARAPRSDPRGRVYCPRNRPVGPTGTTDTHPTRSSGLRPNADDEVRDPTRRSRRSPCCSGSPSSSTASCSPRPAGPTAKFANNPRMTDEQTARSSRRPGAWTSRSRSSTAAGWASATRTSRARSSAPADAGRVHRPDGLAELPADARSAARRTASSTATSATRSTPARRSATGSPARPCPTFILAGTALVVWLTIAIVIGVVRGHQPLLAVRQRGDGVLLRRLRHAHVLARASC